METVLIESLGLLGELFTVKEVQLRIPLRSERIRIELTSRNTRAKLHRGWVNSLVRIPHYRTRSD